MNLTRLMKEHVEEQARVRELALRLWGLLEEGPPFFPPTEHILKKAIQQLEGQMDQRVLSETLGGA